jgi:hypothetical protein
MDRTRGANVVHDIIDLAESPESQVCQLLARTAECDWKSYKRSWLVPHIDSSVADDRAVAHSQNNYVRILASLEPKKESSALQHC